MSWGSGTLAGRYPIILSALLLPPPRLPHQQKKRTAVKWRNDPRQYSHDLYQGGDEPLGRSARWMQAWGERAGPGYRRCGMGMSQRAGDVPAQHACIAARLARLASCSWRHLYQRRHLAPAHYPAVAIYVSARRQAGTHPSAASQHQGADRQPTVMQRKI